MRDLLMLLASAAVVTSAAEAQAPSLTRRLTIGCESCGGSAQFGSIWDVSISPAGELLVTDRNPPMLRRFDTTGRGVWSGGTKGKGPGEFTLPVRSVLIATGMAVVDMMNNRVTELNATGGVVVSIPLTNMATAAGANDRGDVVMGLDDFGRTFKVLVRPAAGSAVRPLASFPGSMKNKSLAIAPDGSIAVSLDNNIYEIQRLDGEGRPAQSIVRDIPQVRRTPEEEAEFRARRDQNMAMVAAEAKRAGGTVSKPTFRDEELGLKGHITVDGLRYDSGGRLWVHTMRGDTEKSVFDVFAPNGTFAGSVTVPMRVSGFSVAGGLLATAGENDEGVPIVVLWTVR